MKENWKQKYDELFRMTETYIRRLHKIETDNENLLNRIEAFEEILETRREHAALADERYNELWEKSNRMRKALERISIGMDIRPFNATAASVEGYFKGLAEAVLKAVGK